MRRTIVVIALCSILLSACTNHENITYPLTENSPVFNPPTDASPDVNLTQENPVVNSPMGSPVLNTLTPAEEPNKTTTQESNGDSQTTLHKLLSTGRIITAEQMFELIAQAKSWQSVNVGVAGETQIHAIEPSDESGQQVYISHIREAYDYSDITGAAAFSNNSVIYTFEPYRRITAVVSEGTQAMLIDAHPAGGSGEVILVYKYVSENSEWIEAFFVVLGPLLYEENTVQEWSNITNYYAYKDDNPYNKSPQEYIDEHGSNFIIYGYSNEKEPIECEGALFERVTGESVKYPGVICSNPVAVSTRHDTYQDRIIYRFTTTITVLTGFFEDYDSIYKAYVYISEPFPKTDDESDLLEYIEILYRVQPE